MGCVYSQNKSEKEEETNEKPKIEMKENEMNRDTLKSVDEKKVQYFTFKGKRLIVKPCNVYDGDTFSIIFWFDNRYVKYKCRCLGYDTPEMKPPLSSPNRDLEIKAAKVARQRFINLLEAGDGLVEVECFDFDKYGRILVNVVNGVEKESLNEIMIKEGHGLAYDGGTKKKFDFDE